MVLDYILKVKTDALRLGDHEADKAKIRMLKGFVFDIFNKAMKKIAAYNETELKALADYLNKLIRTHPKAYANNGRLIGDTLRRMMKGFGGEIKKIKGDIQSSLALLYALHITGM